MLERSRLAAAGAALAAVVATAAPASAVDTKGIAMAPCQGLVAMRLHEWHQTVTVTGAYTEPGAIDVELTCGIVRQGETVARVGESLPGPAAVVAGEATVLGGTIGFCHEIQVIYFGTATFYDTCP